MGIPLSRRQFLATSVAVGASALLPGTAHAGTNQPSGGGPYWDRFLILIELDGGNDGLNMVIPYDVPEYKGTGSVPSRRPSLKYPFTPSSATYLGTGTYATVNAAVGTIQPFALHPSMTHIMSAWTPGNAATHDLAIVLGVGYANPNLSHFRSMDIWNGGGRPSDYPANNWLGRLFALPAVSGTMPSDLTAHGVLLSRYSSNPLRNSGIRYLAMSKPDEFVRRSLAMDDVTPGGTSPHLQHLLTTWHDVHSACGDFRDSLMTLKAGKTVGSKTGSDYNYTPAAMTGSGITFNSTSDFEMRCKSIAEIIATNRAAVTDPTKRLKIPVFKVQLGGFDNHSSQKTKHADLLAQLSSGMASLRAALKLYGLWENALIMTYSEFGRRVEENGSAGTDHGSANCHFLMGGGIKGGFYGAQPGLSKGSGQQDLDSRGNLIATTDFRSLYATAATWLGLPYGSDSYLTLGPAVAPVAPVAPLPCFA